VAADRIRMVPLAVAPVAAVDLRSLGLPAGARVIAAAGRLDASADGRTAVWAFDVLRYADPNLYLLLVGGDPGRGRLERLADALAFDDNRVRFAGPRADAAAMLAAADVVWVTATRGGVNVALEAMAAGRPVVAVRNSDLAGLVDDALVVPPTDRVRLAAVTNELFASPDRLAAAGGHGRAVAARHTVPAAADALAAALSDVRPA
jgi:glycosyltransferase involved in cell wall biosynthesis